MSKSSNQLMHPLFLEKIHAQNKSFNALDAKIYSIIFTQIATEGFSSPSLEFLAHKGFTTTNTAKKSLGKLAKLGLISIEKSGNEFRYGILEHELMNTVAEDFSNEEEPENEFTGSCEFLFDPDTREFIGISFNQAKE